MLIGFREFIAEVAISDSLCGLRNGASVSSIDQIMGDSEFYEEVEKKRAWMRRDYGLVQIDFNPDKEEEWVSFGMKLSVHRLEWGTSIPIPIAALVADIPEKIYFDDLRSVIEPRGGLVRRTDLNFRDEIHYLTEAGADIVATTKDEGGEMVPDCVWEVNLKSRMIANR
ncbi:hypothetical protein ACFVJ5_33435 [Nocardia sp. NPDC127606]|uniref:hypothetical protein n=1 Tax=Nocardia sp. NPDC127606 TaxID=3345406 RepID=UPI0036282A14